MSSKYALVDFIGDDSCTVPYLVYGDPFDRKNGEIQITVKSYQGRAKLAVIKSSELFDTLEDALKAAEVRFIRYGQKIMDRHNKEIQAATKHILNQEKTLKETEGKTPDLNPKMTLEEAKAILKIKPAKFAKGVAMNSTQFYNDILGGTTTTIPFAAPEAPEVTEFAEDVEP